MENQKKKIFFIVKLGIFCLELGKKTYFLALGMGPNFGPKNRVIESPVQCFLCSQGSKCGPIPDGIQVTFSQFQKKNRNIQQTKNLGGGGGGGGGGKEGRMGFSFSHHKHKLHDASYFCFNF